MRMFKRPRTSRHISKAGLMMCVNRRVGYARGGGGRLRSYAGRYTLWPRIAERPGYKDRMRA